MAAPKKGKKVTGKTAASSKEAAAPTIATTSPGHTPTHLVVFKRPSEANYALCSKMGMQQMKGVSSIRAGVTMMSAGRRGAAPSRFYSRLGLMVTDLTARKAREFETSDEVEMVVKNEVRSVPNPIEDYQEVAGTTDPLIAYLQGLRDASDAALRFALRQDGETAPGPGGVQPTALVAQADYPLGLIGMSSSYTKFTGNNVTVAVLDTGIDLNHPDFVGRLTENDNAVSFVPGEGVQDGNGHGTHCAGVVGGPLRSTANRRYGVAPDVDLMVGKVLSDAGRGTDDQIIDGIDWAASSGARIISMSLGSARGAGTPANVLYERVARNLLENDSGSLIIAAAGNESARPHFIAAVGDPAAAKSIIAVAAVDRLRRVASFSCGQRDAIGEVNVSAPGVRIFSSWTGGGFRSISGTSMATPHVAGVAALYLEQNQGLSPKELWNLLESRASAAGSSADFGHGVVQAP